MTSSTSDRQTTPSDVVYRPIQRHEQQAAIDLWYKVFSKPPAGFFERYFDPAASPHYQEGDTIGAWIGEKLVSAVHIRRLRLRSRDDATDYLCGALANVATLEEHRRQGYSRTLLCMAIQRMEDSEDFDLTTLGTNRPNHYARLGWEQLSIPAPITIEWSQPNSSLPDQQQSQWQSASEIFSKHGQVLLDLYSTKPRTYQYNRSPLSVFRDWVGWNWTQMNAYVCVLTDNQQGYVVIAKVDNIDEILVAEWRALNVEVERRLLRLAANEIRRRYPQISVIRFHTPPQYMSLEELEQWAGPLTITKNDHTMIRNIRLPTELFEKIKAAFLSGHATFWPGDYF